VLPSEEGVVLGARGRVDLEVLAGALGWVLGACGLGGAAGFREVQLGDATRSSVEEEVHEEAVRSRISGDLMALAPHGEALDEGR
jgi:hypothetical protein